MTEKGIVKTIFHQHLKNLYRKTPVHIEPAAVTGGTFINKI
jgi:hypothetical protein